MADSPETQPTGLFDYIAGQPSITDTTDLGVTQPVQDSLVRPVSAESSENAPEASSEQTNPGLTPQEPGLSRDDLLRLQQENERLQAEKDRQLEALTLLGIESSRREKTLFEQSIAHLDEEEQAAARERRRVEALEAQNTWLRQSMESQQARAQEAEENINKGRFAQMVHQRMNLPNDPNIFNLLMEAQSPSELVVRANSLSKFYQGIAAQQTQQVAVDSRQSGVHRAGGETAPPKPEDMVPLHSGDLISMMRERRYEPA